MDNSGRPLTLTLTLRRLLRKFFIIKLWRYGDSNPRAAARPLCVNPRSKLNKGRPLSISSTYNSLTLCEDSSPIVLVGPIEPPRGCGVF